MLAIREPGSPDDASTRLADEDRWPQVITAGRFLAPPGGYFPGLAREVTAAELPPTAEQEARRWDGWAKIIGDYLGPGGPFVPDWPADVLAAATTRVHTIGGRVAIHCTCPEAVDAAVAAGVDSVEHGWAVTDSHFAAMRERGIAWVPTLFPGGSHAACEFASAMGFADETLAWMRSVLNAQPATIARADRAGVTVLAGTMAVAEGDPDAAGGLLEQAFALACQVADPCLETWAAHGLGLRAVAAGDETTALSHLADAITRSRPQRGGHLWSHVWALTHAIPLARRAGDSRAPAWHDEALTTAQRSGMRH